jgi:drug/metabolite transporter (DMT)-like permease
VNASSGVTTARRNDSLRVLAAYAAVYFFWGSSYLATRVAVQSVPPFLFGALRFVAAGLIMLLISRSLRNPVLPRQREWRDLLVLALFGFVIANGINVWTLQFVHSNQSALLNTTAPCWIALLGTFGARAHRPSRRAILGLALGFVGAALLLLPAASAARGELWPQALVIVGCLAWAITTIYLRNMGTRLPVFSLIGWQMLLGGIALALIGMVSGELPRWHWSWRSTVPLLYLIFFASCIAHTAYAWLARRVAPASLGTYAYVNPVIATLLGWLLLDEHLEGIQLIGMGVALTGVLLINWPARNVAAITAS